MAKKTSSAKKRVVKISAQGQLHVHSSFNNIIVTLANSEGQAISWSSAGKMGFRGSKKEHSVRSSDGCAGLCQGGIRPRSSQGSGIREGSGQRP